MAALGHLISGLDVKHRIDGSTTDASESTSISEGPSLFEEEDISGQDISGPKGSELELVPDKGDMTQSFRRQSLKGQSPNMPSSPNKTWRSFRSSATEGRVQLNKHIAEVCNIYRYSSGQFKPEVLSSQDHLGKCIFNPEGKKRKIWDFVILGLVVFYVFVVPVRVVWNLNVTGGWQLLDNVADCIFVLDILLNFRTAYRKVTRTLSCA
jgi:hypothetical protein